MQEPTIRTSRLAIAGGLAAALAVGGAGFVIGRTTAPQPDPVAPVTVASPTPAPTPAVDSWLGRAQLIELAAQATDAHTTGDPVPAEVAAAAGRRFELVVPFGCSGPNERGPSMRWHYDEANETLRVTVEPTSWPPDQWLAGQATRYEVAEGFWISRPWSSNESCPQGGIAAPPDTDAITLPGQTLAVAQFFTEGAHRTARRDGRAYEIVKRVPAADFDGSRGFLLRITGRIDNLPDGPVRCIQPAGPQQRPVCVIGVRMDEVAIQNPVTRDVLGSWRTDTAG